MEDNQIFCTKRLCMCVLLILFMFECYLNFLILYKAIVYHPISKKIRYIYTREVSNISVCTMDSASASSTNLTKQAIPLYSRSTEKLTPEVYYKYPLINSTEITMDYKNGYNSSYYWFISMKHLFKNTGNEDTSRHGRTMPACQLKNSSFGLIKVDKSEVKLEWVEQQNRDVIVGGYHAPAHCRASYRVAVIVPYRDRKVNLIIFLRYIHPLLKKQLLDYRIFVIEQYGTEKFNKGTLYNIAYLETQRFGTWHCLIFHDVDLIPEDERISYSCPEHPTHMSPAVEMFQYVLPYDLFGGVTALTPAQYETINGYSNFYWNWGGEDDDIHRRIRSKNYTIERYNSSIARYATLLHPWNECGKERKLFLLISRLRFLKEGLRTTKYNLISVTSEKLYTHILADVNPTRMKLNSKSLMQHIISVHGKSIEYGRQELKLKAISARKM